MSLNNEHTKEIESLIEMSQQNLRDARVLLASEGYRSALSRAYYVFFDMAKAGLLSKDIIPKSHAGAIAKFSEIFVKRGIVEGNYGRSFNRALALRMEADYEALRDFNKDEVKEIIDSAERFFNEVKKKVFISNE